MDMTLTICVINEKVLLSKRLTACGSPLPGASGARVAPVRTQKEFRLAGTVRPQVLCAYDYFGTEYLLAMHGVRVEMVSAQGRGDACEVS